MVTSVGHIDIRVDTEALRIGEPHYTLSINLGNNIKFNQLEAKGYFISEALENLLETVQELPVD